MERQTKISEVHFFSLMVLFQLGTALVVNVGIMAGRDAWIAVLIGMVIGSLLFAIYVYLNRIFPGKLPTLYCRMLFGKYIGGLIGIAYIVFFLNKASRDLMDGGLLVIASTLKETPLLIINLMMILTVAYVLSKGLEVLARTAFVFLAIVLMIGLFIGILILFSDIVVMERLQPVLSDGLGKVFSSVVRQNYQFPFAEVICFVTVLPSLNDRKKGIRAGHLAILATGLILSVAIATTIAVLGVNITERSVFPLLSMVGKASIADFIQRADILVVMVLVIGVFFKISIFYYASAVSISELFRLPYRQVLYPVAIIILLQSAMLARSFSEHLSKGGQVLYLIDPVFFVVLPVILMVAGFIYRRRSSA